MRVIPDAYAHALGKISLRPVGAADLPVLLQIYASTRASEMRQVPWTQEQKADFLCFQFDAQHRYYEQQFPHASRDLVELNGATIGRLYLDPRDTEIRLIDIALLPDHCGKGIGGLLLNSVLEAGTERQCDVSIHVEHNNPALRLYQRLGFVQIEEQGIYFLMRWSPAPNSN